jgi:putative endonuclease
MISPTVYILACKPHNTLYIGSTSNLSQRVWQHRNDLVDGFCAEYSMHTLVHFEQYDDMSTAICREQSGKTFILVFCKSRQGRGRYRPYTWVWR